MSPLHAPSPVELDDIQALVRFGFKHLTQSRFVLLQIRNREAARAWLATAPVSSAIDTHPLPTTALQIAFTSDGLRALGVPSDVTEGLSDEYLGGMSGNTNRSRRLGDVEQNDPARWQWGARDRIPHVLLMLYAGDGLLEEFEQSIRSQWRDAFNELVSLTTSDFGGAEPFGFRDGLSQPTLDWKRERPVRDETKYAYTNLACLGEFLLGYPNEYGGYTDRPLIDPQRAGAASLPRAEDSPSKADLGRNGSYLVMRQLRQDVQGLWCYLDKQADGDAVLREKLAAAMVGRTRDGIPLAGNTVGSGKATSRDDDTNAFTFGSDPDGIRCPLGAHIRRSNPRNADLPPGPSGWISRLIRILGFDPDALANDLVASTRFHRLLRRGRGYGARISPTEALSGTPSASESGLYFICLNANISRQFEFVQSAWIAGTKFDGLPCESDPLLGNRQPDPNTSATDVFSIPQDAGPAKRLTGLPSLVTVCGGAYFFLPGIRALRFIANAR